MAALKSVPPIPASVPGRVVFPPLTPEQALEHRRAFAYRLLRLRCSAAQERPAA
jgi:hypothetical protein